jgi:quercetin dioxygenase-like cupin family protein
MKILRNGDTPSRKGSAETFTGNVRQDSMYGALPPGRARGGIITFEPGARTFWHTHPLGQTLLVTFGVGWTQCEGGPIEEIRAGDVIHCPANHRHWHGATATTAMTHVAIAEALDGVSVTWMEAVTDAQYLAGPKRG